MGDRFYLYDKECAYCNEKQKEEIYFAPTCGFLTFICESCGKENFITTDHDIKKIEDVKKPEVHNAISYASNFIDEKQIKDCTNETYKKLKEKGNAL